MNNPIITASGAIPAYACVKVSTSGSERVEVATSAADVVFGVTLAANTPAGGAVDFQTTDSQLDIFTLKAAGTITIGQYVVPTTNGTVIGASTGPFVSLDTATIGQTFTARKFNAGATANFIATGSGAITRTLDSKLGDMINIKDYGAIGDGTLHTVAEWIPSRYANLAAVQVDFPFVTGTGYSIDLAAINKALLLLSQSRLSPPSSPPSETFAIGLTGWGFGKIYIPRGNYVTNDKIYVSGGTSSTIPTSAIGLCFQGDGAYASNIIYNQSTGDMCHLNICLNVYFADMSFINITSTARGSWTSNAFRIEPVGGGKLFQMDRCYMRNFNIGIKLEGTVNNDTTRINNCFSEGQNTWLFARNSQAIINEINSCSIYRSINKVFDIDGCGYTTVSNCDIIVPGTVLHLAGLEGAGSGLSGNASQYTFINVKMEFWNESAISPALPNDLGTTKIVVTESAQQSFAFIRMIGCGIQGGTPHPDVFQFDLQAGTTTLHIDGGAWGDTNDVLKIRTKTHLGRGRAFRYKNWVKFENCVTSPSKTISRLAEAGQDGWSQQMPVIWKNCASTPDICMYGPSTNQNLSTPVGNGMDRNQNSMNNNGNIAFGHASVFPIDTEHAFPTNGQRVLVQKIYAIASKGDGSGVTILRLEAFKDAAFTQQIGSTTTKTADFAAPFVMEITVPAGTLVTDGVWVRMWHNNPDNLYAGMVYVDTVSV